MGFLESWYEDNISGKDGKYKGRGFGAAILKPFVDEEAIEERVQGTRNKQTATGLGYDLTELDVAPGASTIDVQGAAIRRGKAEAKETKADDLAASLKPLEMRMAQDDKTRQAELTLAREKLAQSNNLTLLQMQQSSDQKIAELQYQKMRDRKTDMQYNERMEMLDRKDRRTAMSNIAAGLASLGAAFAL